MRAWEREAILKKFKRIAFLFLIFSFFNVTMSHSYVIYDSRLSMEDVVSDWNIMDEANIEDELKWPGNSALFSSLASDGVNDASFKTFIRIAESLEEEDMGFDEEFEDEFGEKSESEVFDPLSGYNKFMTKVNDKFYLWILKPTASGYRKVVPEEVRVPIRRFFDNLLFPIRFVNNVLQFKFKGAGVELARFGLNTTLGVGGFADPAQKWFSLNAYPEDFGQTLGFYGVGSGFHFVLPILGPSNFRDTIGLGADFFLDPICYLGSCYAGYWEAATGVRSFSIVNYTSLHLGEYESFKRDSIDFYIFLRDAYEQRRKKLIEE